MTWGLAVFAKSLVASATASLAQGWIAESTGMSGPAPITGQKLNDNGALHLVERRAQRMAGNRRPEAVQAFLRTHRALLTCEGGK